MKISLDLTKIKDVYNLASLTSAQTLHEKMQNNILKMILNTLFLFQNNVIWSHW